MLLECPLVEELDLSSNVIKDIKFLEDLSVGCPSLKRLCLDLSLLPNTKNSIPLLHLPNLESFKITGKELTDNDYASIYTK